MNKTVKWILSVLLALVLIGLAVGTVFLVLQPVAAVGWMPENRPERFWHERDFMPHRFPPAMPGVRMPFPGGLILFPLSILSGGVIWLGLLVLIVLGIISLSRSLRYPVYAPGVSAAAAPPVSCPHCSRIVQTDWNLCPYCGNRLRVTAAKE